MPLTAQQVSKSKPGDKVITLSDGSGLELRISPNGRKGWRFRYVRPNGKRNMISFGTYPETTLAEAREKRIDARRLIAKGIDPAEERKREQNEHQEIVRNKFITLAQEWHTTGATALFARLPFWLSTRAAFHRSVRYNSIHPHRRRSYE
ncbi:Arm DNA-binding domain-containing protein [Larsenimonas suaedae]|uniref:Arm DNA-binding domain-containing protein n=1 Tax=Larsenimonas suaedae TaxID=1851019 RepID=A0ABU1GY72_9GAMM|nr:Arm DNA-binding domain-containing protein [Larsenimonas suaedae]MCM2972905.1 Arm DNA-binding domain-containing protein [Larsenimonas suaedae]MDR5897004.1 Arm DNA-binding domain-containing protein [Larsenimonas suaedae]